MARDPNLWQRAIKLMLPISSALSYLANDAEGQNLKKHGALCFGGLLGKLEALQGENAAMIAMQVLPEDLAAQINEGLQIQPTPKRAAASSQALFILPRARF